MELIVIIVYGLLLMFILAYSLVQLSLARTYARSFKSHHALVIPDVLEAWPPVTIQLPVFNELYVVERLIDAVAAIDYPADKLEIQVLDDGNDDSVELAINRVAFWKGKGINIAHIQRPDRVGYKAGALAYGLEIAKGEFTAIFDADFIPDPLFLRKTIPFLMADSSLGVVQTKWEHVNEDYSMLTRMQAFGLDAHFSVEQVGRNEKGHFINFNGTAGVWRNACIADAGGWQHDTITEDLDLSYRAQLKGWKFKYLEEVGSPSELPAEMNGLKSQQFRWTKGAAECAVKNLGKVIRKKGLPFSTKLHAIFHLMNSFVFLCILGAAMLSLPILWVKINRPVYDLLFNLAAIFLIGFLILAYFYWMSRKRKNESGLKFLGYFPLFLSVSMGLSLHNSIAVIEGYMGKKTPFVRTPKYALTEKNGTWTGKRYAALKANPLTLVELLLMLYFIFGMVLGISNSEFGLLPFHLMLSFGFGYVAYMSIKHSRGVE
ncbi:MAG: glycosyltransferase [Cryomorphaceae bacterium]|nr:glycosyltransferase [Cryomorphaceae bacterium]